MDKNVEKMDAVMNGTYKQEFPENEQAIAELEHLIAIKKLNIKIDETR